MATITDKNGTTPQKGRIGDATYYQRNGKTVVRTRTNSTGNPSRSMQQARSRMVWSNVQNLWSAFPPAWHPGYQNRGEGRTNYNVFMSLNLQCQPIFFSKTESNTKPSVLIPLLISQGSLPEIGIRHEGAALVSSLSVGGLVLTADTTISELCNAIVRNNVGISNGDTLTYVYANQRTIDEMGFPQVQFGICQLDIDCASNVPVSQVPQLAEGFSVYDGFISSMLSVDGAAWVLSRRMGGEMQYSTQRLWCGNADLIAQYSSEEAFERAVDSYGGIKMRYDGLVLLLDRAAIDNAARCGIESLALRREWWY